jgi:TfoX/Sxy family transcriptional regulator of competence genes
MGSSSDTVQFIVDQAGLGDALQFRKMFGEYALYVNGKVVALVCDDQLFIKPTAAGRAELGRVVERPPYPGAKNHFLVGEQLDDRALLQRVLLKTAGQLPEPKPRRARASAVRKPRP